MSYNSCVQLMLRCCYVFVTNGYTVTLLHLWSCAIAMNSTARRYPSYILKEQEGFCHERDASKGQTVLELVSSLLPNSIVVVYMSHPDTSTVYLCRCVVATGFLGTWHWVWHRQPGPKKAPTERKLRSFKVQNCARRYKESKTAPLRIPRHGMVTPGARVAR